VKECNDGSPCTTDSLNQTNGQCVYTPVACQSFSACLPQICAVVNGSATCVPGAPLSCPPPDVCTTSTCDVQKGCVRTPIVCTLDPAQLCLVIDGCYLPQNSKNFAAGCHSVNVTSLIDFCGVCLGDNTACFFSSLLATGSKRQI
jgi:hypothetical protein